MARPALADEFIDGANIAFDTDSLIYFVERHDRFFPLLSPVFARVESGALNGHASFLTLVEVLVGPLRSGLTDLANAYRDLLLKARGFTLHVVDLEIAQRAALVRATWGLRTPDSIVAATALHSGCTHLVSNDPVFRRVQGLTAVIIDDFS